MGLSGTTFWKIVLQIFYGKILNDKFNFITRARTVLVIHFMLSELWLCVCVGVGVFVLRVSLFILVDLQCPQSRSNFLSFISLMVNGVFRFSFHFAGSAQPISLIFFKEPALCILDFLYYFPVFNVLYFFSHLHYSFIISFVLLTWICFVLPY